MCGECVRGVRCVWVGSVVCVCARAYARSRGRVIGGVCVCVCVVGQNMSCLSELDTFMGCFNC